MVKNTAFRRILTFSAAAVMTLSLVACGGGNNAAAPSSKAATSVAAGSSAAASSAASSAVSSAASSAASNTAELSADQIKDLMKQVAEAELEQQYKDVVKAENDYRFANAEVFGIDRTGNSGKMYVYLNTGEYVNFKGKAYFMSGGSGEAIINIEYGDKILNIKIVENIDEAIEHINKFGSHHTDSIISKTWDKKINSIPSSQDLSGSQNDLDIPSFLRKKTVNKQ